MKRRNAILAAVGLNVGLLALLFATATKNAFEKKEEERFAVPKRIEERPVPIARQLPPPPPIPLFQEEEEPQHTFEVAATPVETAVEEVVASAPTATVQVVVKKGDALEKIARAHGTNVEEIMRANKLSSTRLQIGQVLKVPPKQQKSYPIATERAEERSSEVMEEFYIVKSGDSPWTIAAKNHMSVEALLSLNELDEQKAKRLKAGDRLRIR